MVKISVVMSTYNEEKQYLFDAVKSILNQTFKDFEVIIINDNPQRTDLIKILDEINKWSDKIKILNNDKNKGLAYSLNKGIRAANGEYIARMDADDIAVSDRLKKESNYLDNHPDIQIISGNCDYINSKNQTLGKKSPIPETNEQIYKILPIGSDIIHPTVMMRKKSIINIGLYRNFPTAEDYDLWLRCLSNRYKFKSLNEILIHYRIRDNSMTHSDSLLLFLVENYQRQLYSLRKKNKLDNYSEKNLKAYLLEKGYYDQEFKRLYEKGEEYFQKFIDEMQKRNFGSAIKNLKYSFMQTKLNRKRILLFFKYEMISYKIKRG